MRHFEILSKSLKINFIFSLEPNHEQDHEKQKGPETSDK